MEYEYIKLTSLVELGENSSFHFEHLPCIYNVSTYSRDNLITDSAAAGTAISYYNSSTYFNWFPN